MRADANRKQINNEISKDGGSLQQEESSWEVDSHRFSTVCLRTHRCEPATPITDL